MISAKIFAEPRSSHEGKNVFHKSHAKKVAIVLFLALASVGQGALCDVRAQAASPASAARQTD